MKGTETHHTTGLGYASGKKESGNTAGTSHGSAQPRPPGAETHGKSRLVAEARPQGVGEKKKPNQKPGMSANFTVTKATGTRSPGQWVGLGMLKV